MPTLKDTYDELRKKKRRLAIWEAIHHLIDDKFIAKDGRKVSGIKEPDTGDVVPEEEIEDVLQNIADGPILEIRAEIQAIENQELVVIDSKDKASA